MMVGIIKREGIGMLNPSKSVLVVEDHEDSAGSLARLLGKWGYQTQIANNIAQARELATQTRFDLLLCDLGLPDGDGCDLMRELLAQNQIKGIALTGYGDPDDVQRATDAGFAAHLLKPIEIDRLQMLVKKVACDDFQREESAGQNGIQSSV
jgi:CheY-like chemotaxis protein